MDVVLHLVEAAIHIEHPLFAVDAGASRLGDVDARLAGPRLKGGVECLFALDPQLQKKPVREVDQVLVEDGYPLP